MRRYLLIRRRLLWGFHDSRCRASGGTAVAASESEILYWMQQSGGLEGISFCPEFAICLASIVQLIDDPGAIEARKSRPF